MPNLVVLLLAVGLSLVALELVLRVATEPSVTPGFTRTHPTRRYELKPGFRGSTYGQPLWINERGLRDSEEAVGPRADASILVVGDSITFGPGVRLEDTFPKVIERRLRARGWNGVVWNAGVPSYNTVSEWRFLSERVDELRPDLVVVEFTAQNDTVPLRFGSGEPAINQYAAVRAAKDLLRRSYSYGWLATRYYRLRFNLSARRAVATPSSDPRLFRDDFRGWRECRHAMARIATLLKERHIPLVFAIFANNTRLGVNMEEDPLAPVIHRVVAALEEAGVRHQVLLDDAFRGLAGHEAALWLRPDDSHFSPRAHLLAGEMLAEYLLKAGLVPTAGEGPL